MTNLELSSMTVIELRKLAKENGIKLAAKLDKEGIVERIVAGMATDTPKAEPQRLEPKPVMRKAKTTSATRKVAKPADTPATEEKPVQMEMQVAEETPAAQPTLPEIRPVPAAKTAPAAGNAAQGGQTQFKAAWHNPAPRYGTKSAYQATPYRARPAWQASRTPQPRSAMGGDVAPRTPSATVRPANYAPRFGPDAVDPAAPRNEDYRPTYREAPRAPYGANPVERPVVPNESTPFSQQRTPYQTERPTYGQETAAYPQERPAYAARPAFSETPRSFGENAFAHQGGFDSGTRAPFAPRTPYRRNDGYYNQELGTSNPAVPEMLATGECGDGTGILEIHPDGYGFLRAENCMPSSRDIYVSMAQIRRFSLRNGDLVTGKTRPQREGDKFAAMLYITEVNGTAPDGLGTRLMFDELTPIYPTRRIDLEAKEGKTCDSMRLVDLIAPLGFGQRGLLLCPPETGKTEMIRDFANAIHGNYPDVTVMVLLIDETPEDVTLFREQVACSVMASTFDQSPESHLRLTDMVMERGERLVEQGKDVVLIVDSLTRLAKVYTTSAVQQGRSVPGMVNPTSLFRAKKLFGAARSVKEGGSLTVIGAMNIETGSKVDDTVVEEFKGTANMELRLDRNVAAGGIAPAINLQASGTKRVDMLLTEKEQEGLKAVRTILGATPSAVAIPQLLQMMDKAENNDELLSRIHEWVALMAKSK